MSASKSHSESRSGIAPPSSRRALAAWLGVSASVAAHAAVGIWVVSSSATPVELRAPTASVKSGWVTVRMVRDDREADPAPAQTSSDGAPSVRESTVMPIERTTTRLADAPEPVMDRVARAPESDPRSNPKPQPTPTQAMRTRVADESPSSLRPSDPPVVDIALNDPDRPASAGHTPFMYGAPRFTKIERTPQRFTKSTARQKAAEPKADAEERTGKRARDARPDHSTRNERNEHDAEGPNDADSSPSAASRKNNPGATSEASPTGEIVPTYPALSRRMGEEGRVVLAVRVLASGRAGEIRVERDPGHPRLVKSAKRAVRHAAFTPATSGGEPVDFWLVVPVRFVLR